MSINIPPWKGDWSSLFYCFVHSCTVLAVAHLQGASSGTPHKASSCRLFHVLLSSGAGTFSEGAVGFTICSGLGRYQGSCIMNPFARRDSKQGIVCLKSMPGRLGKGNGRVYVGSDSPGPAQPLHPCRRHAGAFSSCKWLPAKCCSAEPMTSWI